MARVLRRPGALGASPGRRYDRRRPHPIWWSPLPPRLLAAALLAAIALLTLSSAALAAPRDVLRDYEDNGQIDGCYSAADYERSIGLIDPDLEQYGLAEEVIRQAQLERVLQPDGSCGSPAAAGGGDDGGGLPAALVVVLILAGAAIVGAGGYWLSRRSRAGRHS